MGDFYQNGIITTLHDLDSLSAMEITAVGARGSVWQLGPDVLDVVEKNSAFMEAHPGDNIPRYLGTHAFRTGDATGERVVHSYSQWLFQRAWDHYHDLEGEGRQRADALLERIGGLEAMQTSIEHRVRRKRGQLELVEDTGGQNQ